MHSISAGLCPNSCACESQAVIAARAASFCLLSIFLSLSSIFSVSFVSICMLLVAHGSTVSYSFTFELFSRFEISSIHSSMTSFALLSSGSSSAQRLAYSIAFSSCLIRYWYAYAIRMFQFAFFSPSSRTVSISLIAFSRALSPFQRSVPSSLSPIMA